MKNVSKTLAQDFPKQFKYPTKICMAVNTQAN
jgi:hypothetical protein